MTHEDGAEDRVLPNRGLLAEVISPEFAGESGDQGSSQLEAALDAVLLREIVHGVIDRTQAKLAIFDEPMKDMKADLEAGNPGVHILFGQEPLLTASDTTIQRAEPKATDTVGMQLTSGTTGFPKICVWKQHSMLAALDGMAAAMKAGSDDIYLNWTPLYHDMGLVNNFLLCLSKGIPLVMLKPHDFVKDPALWLRAISDTGATITWAPNFGFALAAQRVRDDQIDTLTARGPHGAEKG